MFKMILNEPVSVPKSVTVEARNLLKKLLVKEPAERPNISEVLDHPWFKLPIPS